MPTYDLPKLTYLNILLQTIQIDCLTSKAILSGMAYLGTEWGE